MNERMMTVKRECHDCGHKGLAKANVRIAPLEDFVVDATIPAEEIARRVRLAFKRMRSDMALAVFAKVMTSNLNDAMKVVVWEVPSVRDCRDGRVRKSLHWWFSGMCMGRTCVGT